MRRVLPRALVLPTIVLATNRKNDVCRRVGSGAQRQGQNDHSGYTGSFSKAGRRRRNRAVYAAFSKSCSFGFEAKLNKAQSANLLQSLGLFAIGITQCPPLRWEGAAFLATKPLASLGRPEPKHASRAVDVIDAIFRRRYLLIIFVDGSSARRVYLHTCIGHRYKDDIILAVSSNRVGSLTWRGRIGVDHAHDKGGHHRVVSRVENWHVNAQK